MKMILTVTSLCLTTLPTAAFAGDSPTKMIKGATGTIWTSQPVQAVTTCVAKALNVQKTGAMLTAANGTRYEIGEPTQRGSAYSAQISWFDVRPTDETGEKVVRCALVEPATVPPAQ